MDFLTREGCIAVYLIWVASLVAFVIIEGLRSILIKRGLYDPELGWLISLGKHVRKNPCNSTFHCADCGRELQTPDGCYRCGSLQVTADTSTKIQ